MAEARSPSITQKLWGCEHHIVTTEEYTGKILYVNPGFISSVHMHKNKKETFYVHRGVIRLSFYSIPSFMMSDGSTLPAEHQDIVADMEYVLGVGRIVTIEPYMYHSFEALWPAEVFEFSTPHSDDDVYRIKTSGKTVL